ncbi:hypothetical protein TL16_g13307, partial [Triparma laevis f. inornata]
MVATGTGIAPYRGFIRRLFMEETPAREAYAGEAWLFLGVANSDALLYDDEWQEAKANPTANGGKVRNVNLGNIKNILNLLVASLAAAPPRLRPLPRGHQQEGRQDVHPGQGRGV